MCKMSQDLLAAFNPVDFQATSHSKVGDDHTVSTQNHLGHLSEVSAEEDFGDFEDASAQQHVRLGDTSSTATTSGKHDPKSASQDLKAEQTSRFGQHPFAGRMDLLFAADDEEYDAGQDELNDLSKNPELAMRYSKQLVEAQQTHERSANRLLRAQMAPNEQSEKMGGIDVDQKTHVLFDAFAINQDDAAFGDFEEFEETSAIQLSKQSAGNDALAVDLVLIDREGTSTFSRNSTLSGKQQHVIIQAVDHKPDLISASSYADSLNTNDDDWQDFHDSDFNNDHKTEVVSRKDPTPTTQTPSNHQKSHVDSISDENLPPTNIPPPAILLSVFPSIFTSADQTLWKQLSKLDSKQRDRLLTHPATHSFLVSFLHSCTVLGHIVAGRRLRWKRDQFLAQGMRIGPAAAGGKSGMKLAGLDRSESVKEDQAVVETIRQYRAQVGKLRTSVTTARQAKGLSKLPPVPDISEQMPVKVVKATEGGFTAPRPCALCGLKREERVSKLDMDVNDSFGEWWTQNMSMHTVCREFWQEYKGKLR